MDETEAFEKRIGYTFRDRSLLSHALTLSSASGDNNQKMECFGDALLDFLVTEEIYGSCDDEKQMTVKRQALVCDAALRRISEDLGIDALLIKGKGDVNNRKAVPSGYEAVLAAIYMDGGIDAARRFVLSTIRDDIPADGGKDPKSRLQELMQSRGLPLPQYSHTDVGNPQRPDFIASVTADGKTYEGRGPNVKTAEKKAAKKALDDLGA